MKPNNNAFGTDNQQERLISKDYLAGFTDGEGSFYVGFSRQPTLPLKWQVITEFHVSQNPGGKNVLEYFRKILGCGYLKPNHAKSLTDKSWVFVVKTREDLEARVIPFFKKHPLHTNKLQDFEKFCQVLQLIKKRKHLTKEGFKNIVKLILANENEDHRRYSKSFILSHLN